MAQALFINRKRSRDTCEEDRCDCVPLTKKINTMHFSGNVTNGLLHHVEHITCEEGKLSDTSNDLQGQRNVRHLETQSFECSYSADQNNSNTSSVTPNETNIHMVSNSYIESSWTAQSPASQEHPWMSNQILSQYMPDLSASDNPYYYENNKLLFALYMERRQRGGDQCY